LILRPSGGPPRKLARWGKKSMAFEPQRTPLRHALSPELILATLHWAGLWTLLFLAWGLIA
ncbi:MAG: hypothetical protein ACK5NZ_03710, partial [bacterium]